MMSDSISRLEEEIAALRRSLATPGLAASVEQMLRALLADKEAQLARLRGGEGSQVGSRPAVSFGPGSQFGDLTFGDIAGGSIIKDNVTVTGPTINGPISAGRDVNVGTHQMITNLGRDEPATRPAPAPARPAGPALRLELADGARAPLAALTVGEEAYLRAVVEGDQALPGSLELTLEAEAAGVSWPDDTRRRLLLRPGEQAAPARWAVVPRQAGPLTFHVAVLAGGTLVQRLTLVAQAQAAGAVLSGPRAVPVAPPVFDTPVGLSLAAAAAQRPPGDQLALLIGQDGRGYRLSVPATGDERTLPHTPAQLADLAARARAELLDLLALAHDDETAYVNGVAIPEPLAKASLARLAPLGAALWDGLFHPPGGGEDLTRFGQNLRERSRRGQLHITIGGDLPGFPWQLLYDRDPQVEVTPDGFWGLRHVLALQPTRRGGAGLVESLSLGQAGKLRAVAAYNLGIRVADLDLIGAQRAALAPLFAAVEELTTERELQRLMADGTEAEVLYLYCHALNAQPGRQPAGAEGNVPAGVGSTRLILTDEAGALTLNALAAVAPLRKAPLLQGGPLVVLNACGSAALSPLSYDGLAPYLLAQGARAVVGTECDTPVIFGAAFGPALLALVARGGPGGGPLAVGDALLAARRQFWSAHHNPLGLLYTLYGFADLQVAQEAP